jgi:hypothetical protein
MEKIDLNRIRSAFELAYKKKLSDKECYEIYSNLVGFFSVLLAIEFQE